MHWAAVRVPVTELRLPAKRDDDGIGRMDGLAMTFFYPGGRSEQFIWGGFCCFLGFGVVFGPTPPSRAPRNPRSPHTPPLWPALYTPPGRGDFFLAPADTSRPPHTSR